MTIDFSIKHFDYKNRIGNLTKEAVGEVKSEKHFPTFQQKWKRCYF